MSKRFQLTESEVQDIRKKYFFEQSNSEGNKRFCHSGNVKTLEDIVGDDEASDYVEGVKLRKNGLGGIIDRLELLKSMPAVLIKCFLLFAIPTILTFSLKCFCK